jgi:hypothetical protein
MLPARSGQWLMLLPKMPRVSKSRRGQAIAPVVCVQNRYGIGASPGDPDHLTANVAAAALRLIADEMTGLESLPRGA